MMNSFSEVAYSELDSAWEVDRGRGTFIAPLVTSHHDQRIVFDETFRDGSIEAEVTARSANQKSTEPESKTTHEARIGAIIFRFQNANNYYVGGIGAFGSKFFLSRVVNGEEESIAVHGDSQSLEKRESYRIEVRCSGNRLSLSHNNITLLQAFDNKFRTGQWGFRAYGRMTEFTNIFRTTIKPNCFVIMPFQSEFDKVYQVIRETIESHSYDCIRADERYLVRPIIDDVRDQIERADLIVADLTDKNPNVYYEVGYAAALRKPVIQIAQSSGDLPFDVQHLRTFVYSTKILGDRDLARDLSEAIRATA